MIVAYVVVIWGTIVIGAAAGNIKRRGAIAAILGSLVSYGVLAGGLALDHAVRGHANGMMSPESVPSLMPPLVNLLDGLLSGAGLCLALSIDGRLSRRTS